MSGPIDVALMVGQSNCLGHGDSSQSTKVPAGAGYEYTTDGQIVPLADPFNGALTGSAWPSFVSVFTQASGVPMCAIGYAIGGTPLLAASGGTRGNWSPSGSLVSNAASKFTAGMSALTSAGWTPTPRVICWDQGERDAQNYPTQSTLQVDYQAAFSALPGRFATALGLTVPMFAVFRTGDQAGYEDGYAAVRNAQDAAVAATSGMFMAYTDAITFASRGWMNPDGLHYDQQGLNDMGLRGGAAVAQAFGYTVPILPPPPTQHNSSIASAVLSVIR